jgi:hypothetical protein
MWVAEYNRADLHNGYDASAKGQISISNYINYHYSKARLPPFADPGNGGDSGYAFTASGGDETQKLTDEQLAESVDLMLLVGPLNKLTAMPTMLMLKRFANLYAERGSSEKGCSIIDKWVQQADEMYRTTSKTERLKYFSGSNLQKARVHPRYADMLNTKGEILMGANTEASVKRAIAVFRKAAQAPTSTKNLESKAYLARALSHPKAGATREQIVAAASTCARVARSGSQTHQMCTQLMDSS